MARLRPWADPAAAFRVRAARDRKKLIRASKPLRRPTRWRRAAAAFATIELLAHGLAGASGLFGFAALGEEAARLERLLERWRARPPAEISRQRIAAFVRRLDPLLASLARVNRREDKVPRTRGPNARRASTGRRRE